MNGQETLSETFRDVMAGMCTPVSIVTAMDGDRPHGTTVSAFASLSLDPPMVLAALDRESDLLALVRRDERFGVNVLASAQSEIAAACARKGNDKFAHVDWHVQCNVPRLDGVSGWLACAVHQLVEGGDHVIALGTVLEAKRSPATPLTYHAREFGTHAALEVQPQ